MDTLTFALIAALIWGVTPIIDKMGLVDVDPDIGVAIRAVAVLVAMGGYLVFSGRTDALMSVSPRSAALLALAGILAALLGQLAYYHALKGGSASLVVPVSSLYILVAAILGVTLLGEQMTTNRAVGIALIIGGMVLLR